MLSPASPSNRHRRPGRRARMVKLNDFDAHPSRPHLCDWANIERTPIRGLKMHVPSLNLKADLSGHPPTSPMPTSTTPRSAARSAIEPGATLLSLTRAIAIWPGDTAIDRPGRRSSCSPPDPSQHAPLDIVASAPHRGWRKAMMSPCLNETLRCAFANQGDSITARCDSPPAGSSGTDGPKPSPGWTNDLSAPGPSTLPPLYKAPVQIELLFRWIKRNLPIPAAFLGNNDKRDPSMSSSLRRQ